MVKNGVEKLKTDLKSRDFARLYVLFGEENYLTEHYRRQISGAFSDLPFSEFNILTLDHENLSRDSFSDFCENLPMFAERKLLFLDNPNIAKMGADLRDFIAEQFENVPDYAVIVITFTDPALKPDRRLKIWQTLEKQGVVCNFEPAARSDILAWIKRRCSALGKDISSANAEYLTFLCGGLMTNLITEIEKIASGTASNEISRHNIDALASPVLEAKIFELTDKITTGDGVAALEITNRLFFLKNEPIAVCGAISRQIGRIYGAKLCDDGRKSEDYAAKLLGYTGSKYPLQLVKRAASRRSKQWLREAVVMCHTTDLQLKSNIPGDERKVELLVLRLCAAR